MPKTISEREAMVLRLGGRDIQLLGSARWRAARPWSFFVHRSDGICSVIHVGWTSTRPRIVPGNAPPSLRVGAAGGSCHRRLARSLALPPTHPPLPLPPTHPPQPYDRMGLQLHTGVLRVDFQAPWSYWRVLALVLLAAARCVLKSKSAARRGDVVFGEVNELVSCSSICRDPLHQHHRFSHDGCHYKHHDR